MESNERPNHQRWAVVLVLAFFLHVYVASQSDLGLDAHVRLNALSDGTTEGQELTWGPARITGSTNENKTAVYDGYVPPWNTSESAMKITAISSLVLMAAFVSLRPRYHAGSARFDLVWGSMLMLSPVLLFSTSRGYDEAPLALLMALGVVGFWFQRGETPAQQRLNGALMATSLLLVMVWKGFPPFASLAVWVVMLMITEIWVALCKSGRYTNDGQWLGNPWTVGACTFCAVYGGVFVVGFASSSGTFSTIGEQPLNFLIASGFALFDAVVLYLLVGCLSWPFFAQRRLALRSARGPGFTMLVVYISAVLAGIVAYIATLWTLEATLWNMSLAKVMVVLGNNGRYATMLLIPMVALLRWEETIETNRAIPETKTLLQAIVLVLPFVLFLTLAGHQLWSEDAGEVLADSWASGDETVLLIAPESMAMHHLYVIKTNLDLDGSQTIQGLWTTPNGAPTILDVHSGSIDFVVVAPGASTGFDTASWDLVHSQEVPVSVPGGIQTGSWSLYRLPA